ncbi:CD109 antigen isoform X1 [Drosophila grimshawi]|uniref:CD109 antigen isoform X1 n=2 Tax=Drosophila grimshawi TaxID=7222 RepID=UPI001C93576E|nr:CD109 antigen isoform X1 [Drosophila grimshawi]
MRRLDAFGVIASAVLVLLLQMAEPVKCEGQYTIVGPGTIHSNRDYNVAVAVHHTKEPVTLKVGITGPSYNDTQTVELANADEPKQITFKLPPLVSGDYNLTAEGVSGLDFKNSTKLNWEKFRPYVTLQTDKGKYKPGDIINYRVLFLDENLRPTDADDEVVVWFEDSKKNRIKELKHIKTRTGVYTGKFELSDFATLGSWTLTTQNGNPFENERAYFNVEKYVLPKYIVKMDATQQVSVRDGDMQVVIKANYTYGKPVNGKVVLNLHTDESSTWSNVDGKTVRTDTPGHAIIRSADMVNGKAKFDINVKEFASYLPHKTSSTYAQILATVEEEFTGVQLNETSGTQIFPYRYEMYCADYQSCYSFKPDQEHQMIFKISLVDGTLLQDTKTPVKVKFTEGIRRSHYGDESELPKIENKTLEFESHLNESSLAVFNLVLPDLPDMENYTRYYTIQLEFEDEQRQLYTTYPYREPKKVEKTPDEIEKASEWFNLDVQRPNKDIWGLTIGQEYQVTLNSSRPLKYFVYNIIGRGNVLHTERVVLSEPKTVYNISMTPSFYTTPYGKMYVYYVDDTGEFRYAETTFHVIVKLQNQINITAPAEVKPGAEVELEIRTAPMSFVGLMAVDQSVLLLGSNNDISKNSFSWRLSRYSTYTAWQGGYSYYPGERSGVVTMTNANFFYDRTPPKYGIGFQSIAHRKTAMVASDGLQTTAAAFGAAPAAHFAESGVGVGSAGTAANAPVVRKNFVETWIFDDIENTKTEIFKWVKKIPDTITSWVVTAFAVHPEKGLAVTDDQLKIKTFQPFFVSVRLPYSVKRGEVINVPALVFNYLPKNLDVEVSLDNEDNEYDFVDISNEVIGEQKRSQTVRVEANSAAGVNFLLRPKIIGSILLKFTAISPLAGDAIHKTLKVVPEGVTEYRNRAFFVNLKDVHEHKDTIELDLPDDIVPDSQHVEFGFVGDLLGPVVKNMEHLLRLPSGCGEQTMSAMVPNYLVHDYLNSLNKLTPELEKRIKRNLEQGYQRMFHYRHDDGSYSSFGPGKWREEDPERNGSTWLTAYVLSSFAQMKNIIKVDDNQLDSSYQFLINHQAENGSFFENGEYFYTSQSSRLSMTANVLLALMEQPKPNQTAIDKAVAYLSAETNAVNTKEELLPRAIATYALQKVKAADAGKHVATLKALAKTEDDRTWWAEDDQKVRFGKCDRWCYWIFSRDIEITSYALLALLETEQETPASVLNSIRWLVAQRNSYGGFSSTQDTIAGLRALIKFAKKSGYEPARWEVSISNQGLREKTEKLQLNADNDLLLQTVEFPQGTKSLSYEAKGTGAALLQIAYQYNIIEKDPKPSFRIETIIKPESPPSKLELSVCVEYVEEGKAKASNMAILEVSLPSGFTVDEDSFKEIQAVKGVRLVETKNDDSMVVIYFESLAKGEVTCLPIEALKTHSVANQKPAPIVLYDYYDTNKKATEYYQIESKLCDICEGSDCPKC